MLGEIWTELNNIAELIEVGAAAVTGLQSRMSGRRCQDMRDADETGQVVHWRKRHHKVGSGRRRGYPGRSMGRVSSAAA